MTTTSNQPTESLHARIPYKTVEKLDQIANTLGRSRNWVFNEALKQYVEINEWQINLIKERLAEAKKSNAVFIPHDKIMDRQEKRLKKKIGL